jgi:hypothetical protein
MKRLFLVTCLVLATIAATFGQSRDKKMKSKKLSKSEAANLTQEQRLVHETDRKSKGGKKKISNKKKQRIQTKQTRAARRTKQPGGSQRAKPK